VLVLLKGPSAGIAMEGRWRDTEAERGSGKPALSAEPVHRGKAFVDATTFWKDPKKLAQASESEGLGTRPCPR
jgi:hypothetical protein